VPTGKGDVAAGLDPTAPADADLDLETPDAPASDTAANTLTPPSDQFIERSRYVELQRKATRDAQELKRVQRELEYQQGQSRAKEPEPEQESEQPPTDREVAYWREQYVDSQWKQVENDVGSDVVESYRVFAEGLDKAFDKKRGVHDPRRVMDAYLDSIRLLAGQSAPETPPPTRTDANRSDVGLAPDLDKAKSEAEQRHDLASFLRAAGVRR
jgi:hypothetical protein